MKSSGHFQLTEAEAKNLANYHKQYFISKKIEHPKKPTGLMSC